MTAYSDAYRALTRDRALRADEAAALLARLRREHGDELADALGTHATDQYRPTESDTRADARRKRRAYGAVMRAVNLAREIAANPFRATVPPQGDTTNRSTS